LSDQSSEAREETGSLHDAHEREMKGWDVATLYQAYSSAIFASVEKEGMLEVLGSKVMGGSIWN
jgi:hypothetical protein